MYAFMTTFRPAARARRPGSCLLVDEAQLHPYDFRANGNRVLDNRRHVLRPAKDVHDIDPIRHIPQARICSLSMRFGDVGIDGNDPVATSCLAAPESMTQKRLPACVHTTTDCATTMLLGLAIPRGQSYPA